ncbi:APCD1-like protein [Mya arenaria]|uniref:APCD1-like protein n=1 Tax=Mya arenaria TaxID=6604 RepID=A0ABY7ER69_MYAAR|nr:APCD1-like protein [Mya arenaria]
MMDKINAQFLFIMFGICGTWIVAEVQPRKWAEDDCQRSLRESLAISVKTRSPPKLSGHWTSTKCEVRPGPEFVLRKYVFRKSGFFAQLFYYADEQCSHVTHYVSARGKVKPLGESWRTPGGVQSKYSLSEVKVIPYSEKKAHTFGKLVRRFCPDAKVKTVSPYRKFSIFKFPLRSKRKSTFENLEDFDCTKLFNFTMNELQLLRVERKQLKSIMTKSSEKRLELHLGDVSTEMTYRWQHVPTYYQIPLVKAKTPGCEVCSILSSANHRRPPALLISQHHEVALSGEWVSERCETRPNGQFLTRHLSFLGWRSFQGVYEFYRDPDCSEASYSIAIKGTYVLSGKSDVIPSASEFIFETSRLKITPQNYQMLMYMNSYAGNKCGDSGNWKTGVTQDVTSTEGCVLLGISLPHVEYELMKTEYDNRHSYLYVGQRPSDYVPLSDVKNRPTSFQHPLVRCGSNNEIMHEVSPVFDQYSAYSGSDSMAVPLTSSSEQKKNQNNFIIAVVDTMCTS